MTGDKHTLLACPVGSVGATKPRRRIVCRLQARALQEQAHFLA